MKAVNEKDIPKKASHLVYLIARGFCHDTPVYIRDRQGEKVYCQAETPTEEASLAAACQACSIDALSGASVLS